MPKRCQKSKNMNVFNGQKLLPKLYTRVRFPPPAPPILRAAVPSPRSQCAAKLPSGSATTLVAVSQRLRLHGTGRGRMLRKVAPRSEPAPQGRRSMRITLRHLAFTGALALGAVGLLPSRGLLAQSSDEASVSAAVEALTKAMLDADRARLDDLTSDQ